MSYILSSMSVLQYADFNLLCCGKQNSSPCKGESLIILGIHMQTQPIKHYLYTIKKSCTDIDLIKHFHME